MAIILTAQERETFKRILNIVFEDSARLDAEIARAQREAKTHPGDHQSAVLGAYARMLQEIRSPSAAPRAVADAAMPSLEELKRKYQGPQR